MADLQSFKFIDQCTAVAMLVENAATQTRKMGEAPEDTVQMVAARDACQLARDTLDSFLERLPVISKASKI